MINSWPKLKSPPIIFSAFEVRFSLPVDWHVSVLKRNDLEILESFSHRQDNFKGNINIPAPIIGVSTAQVSTNQVGYTYINSKERKKIFITKENLSFVSEGSYPGWDGFKAEFASIINHYSYLLTDHSITRVSARFINKIKIKEIQSPNEFFTVGISAADGVIKYPIDSYYYRYIMHVPDNAFKININHSIGGLDEDGYDAVLDIDVLNLQEFNYNWDEISVILEEIRQYKNETFFNNLTEKTLDLLK